jgi:hypothetical protein
MKIIVDATSVDCAGVSFVATFVSHDDWAISLESDNTPVDHYFTQDVFDMINQEIRPIN